MCSQKVDRRVGELVHHGLVLLLASLAFWLCLSRLVVPLLTAGGAREAGGLHLALAAIGALAGGVAFFRHLGWWRGGRWQGRSGGPFRLLLYCLVAQAALYLGLFQPFDLASFSTASTAAAGAFSLLLVLRRPVEAWLAERRGPRRLANAFDLAAFYLCVLLVGAEVALRLTASFRPSVLLARAADAPARKIAASRPAPGRMRMGFPVNRSGFYDVDLQPEARDRPLVVAIGDSFSMGVVPHSDHFTSVAERRLPGVQVYNMGVAAIAPPEYLHLLRTEALKLEPDVVVVNLFLGNDLTFSLPPADEAFLRSWYSRDNLLLYQLFRRLSLLHGADPADLGEAAEGTSESSSAARGETSPWLSDPALEPPTFARGDFLRIETSRAEALNSLSEIEFQRRFAVLRQIVDAAAKVPVVFLLIPDEFQVEDDVWEDVERHSPGTLERNRGLDLLVQWLRKEGLSYANLLPLLRSQTPLDDGRLHLYRFRDTHFNARGNRVAGEALADLVRPLLPTVRAARSRQVLPVYGREDDDSWINDLQLFNPHPSSTAVTLKLTLFTGQSVEVPTLLQPGTAVVIDDLGRRSGLAGAGFVSVWSDRRVIAGLRSYQRRSTGSFGDFVPPLALREDQLPDNATLAAVIDPSADDLTIRPDLPSARQGVLIGLAHAAGDGGRTVRSNLSVYAPDGGEVALSFAAYGPASTARAFLKRTLAAGETLPLEDVVALAGRRETEGVLWYRASRPVLAAAYTSRTGDPGPSAQTILPAPIVGPDSEAYFLFASRTGTAQAGARSDLALVNPGTSEVRIDIRLAGESAVKSRTVAVAPRCAVRLEDVVGWLGRDQLSDGVIAVRGDGPFAGALTRIDLRSGDVTSVQPLAQDRREVLPRALLDTNPVLPRALTLQRAADVSRTLTRSPDSNSPLMYLDLLPARGALEKRGGGR